MNESRQKWDISGKAILKLIATAGLLVLFTKIFTICVLLLLGIFVAITLQPAVEKLQSIGCKRSFAIGTIGFVIAFTIGAFCFLVLPSIFTQVTVLVKSLPVLRNAVLENLPGDATSQNFLRQALEIPKMPSTEFFMDKIGTLLSVTGEGVSEIFLVLIFSIYILAGGSRAYHWLCDFFSAPVRFKLHATGKEAALVVRAYVFAQIATSIMSGVFVYACLTALEVPAAITIASIAAVMDIIPVVGFFLAVIPATLLALTVSPFTGIVVFVSYGLYHLFEAYYIAPLIYGRRMKVSSIVILLAILIAGTTGGILVAIAILPVVASYPIIERIWLVKYLGRHVVSKHADGAAAQVVVPQVELWSTKFINIQNQRTPASFVEKSNSGRKILIVEDDIDVRSMLKEILDSDGYTTFSAANGRDGLNVLQKNHDTGLIFLDISMPIMDGHSFLEAVKSNQALKNIPVIFLSSSLDETNMQGATSTLRKPAELEDVLATAEKYCLN